MKRAASLLIVLLLVFSLYGCASRNKIYERRSSVYKETPAPATSRPWDINVTEAPEPTPTEENPEATPELPFKFTGYAYCVINASTGKVLLGDNENTRNYIASITKLLTVLTALDWLTTSERVYVEKGWLDWLYTGGIDCYGIRDGQSYIVSDLVNMALVRSFGDAAVVLEKATEARSGRKFTDLMNEKAWLYGMRDSHFDNVVGLDVGNNFPNNFSTAEDAARLMAEAVKNDVVVNACSGKNIKLSTGGVLNNTSAFLTGNGTSSLYTIIGGKTGYTKAAGSNLAVAVKSNATGTVFVVAYLHGIGMNVLGGEIKDMLEYLCKQEIGRY